MKKMCLFFYAASVALLLFASCSSTEDKSKEKNDSSVQTPATEPEGLAIFRKAYPDITFVSRYDEANEDWRIQVTVPSKPQVSDTYSHDAYEDGSTYIFYWADGALIPEEELKNRDQYWTLLYRYEKELADPALFTPEQTEQIANFGSTENRTSGAGTPMFFFDALYDSSSRASLEAHITRVSFLGRSMNVHERIVTPLKKVENRINEEAKTDSEVQYFKTHISSLGAYSWRIISGTNRKSFHSLGIAIDIQPTSLGGKAIYWEWEKERNPNGWMLIPLSKRWMPPQKVIDIFEEEGFIWGGKWIIFDNMHFEYHPELILFSGIGGAE